MPWEELPARGQVRADRNRWSIQVSKNYINLYVPLNHAIAKAGAAGSMIGTSLGRGEHLGLLRLSIDAKNGRKLMWVSNQHHKYGAFIRYTTLPSCPATLPLTDLEIVEDGETEVTIKLPWLVVEKGGHVVLPKRKETPAPPPKPPQTEPIPAHLAGPARGVTVVDNGSRPGSAFNPMRVVDRR